jgi:hypothetical protein
MTLIIILKKTLTSAFGIRLVIGWEDEANVHTFGNEIKNGMGDGDDRSCADDADGVRGNNTGC